MKSFKLGCIERHSIALNRDTHSRIAGVVNFHSNHSSEIYFRRLVQSRYSSGHTLSGYSSSEHTTEPPVFPGRFSCSLRHKHRHQSQTRRRAAESDSRPIVVDVRNSGLNNGLCHTEMHGAEPAPRSAVGRACPTKCCGYAARGNVVIRGIRKRDQHLPGSGHQSNPLSEYPEILRLTTNRCQSLSVCPPVTGEMLFSPGGTRIASGEMGYGEDRDGRGLK